MPMKGKDPLKSWLKKRAFSPLLAMFSSLLLREITPSRIKSLFCHLAKREMHSLLFKRDSCKNNNCCIKDVIANTCCLPCTGAAGGGGVGKGGWDLQKHCDSPQQHLTLYLKCQVWGSFSSTANKDMIPKAWTSI